MTVQALTLECMFVCNDIFYSVILGNALRQTPDLHFLQMELPDLFRRIRVHFDYYLMYISCAPR